MSDQIQSGQTWYRKWGGARYRVMLVGPGIVHYVRVIKPPPVNACPRADFLKYFEREETKEEKP